MAATTHEVQKALDNSPIRIETYGVDVTSTASTFRVTTGDVYTPSTITLTAEPGNIYDAPTYAWHYSLDDDDSTWILVSGQTSAVLVVTDSFYNTNFSDSTFMKFRVTVTQASKPTVTNTYTVFNDRSALASDSITVNASNETHAVATDSEGNNPDFTNSGTEIAVFEGETKLQFELGTGYPTVAGRFRIQTTPTAVTPGTPTVVGQEAVFLDLTGMSADLGNIIYSVYIRRLSGTTELMYKRQTFNKVKTGASGTKSINLEVFSCGTSTPSPPGETGTYYWTGYGSATYVPGPEIVFFDDFNGAAGPLAGRTPDVVTGGATWTDGVGYWSLDGGGNLVNTSETGFGGASVSNAGFSILGVKAIEVRVLIADKGFFKLQIDGNNPYDSLVVELRRNYTNSGLDSIIGSFYPDAGGGDQWLSPTSDPLEWPTGTVLGPDTITLRIQVNAGGTGVMLLINGVKYSEVLGTLSSGAMQFGNIDAGAYLAILRSDPDAATYVGTNDVIEYIGMSTIADTLFVAGTPGTTVYRDNFTGTGSFAGHVADTGQTYSQTWDDAVLSGGIITGQTSADFADWAYVVVPPLTPAFPFTLKVRAARPADGGDSVLFFRLGLDSYDTYLQIFGSDLYLKLNGLYPDTDPTTVDNNFHTYEFKFTETGREIWMDGVLLGSDSTIQNPYTSGFAWYCQPSNGGSGPWGTWRVDYMEISTPAIVGGGSGSGYTPPTGWSLDSSGCGQGQTLYVARITLTDGATSTDTTIDWTQAAVSSYGYIGTDGAEGLKAVTVEVFAWAVNQASTPALVGSSIYTWASQSFAAPSGWSLDTSGGSVGETLFAARVTIFDVATALVTDIDWTSAGILSIGYKGTDGGTGQQGASARRAYVITTNTSLAGTTITKSGDQLLENGDFGVSGWSATPGTPTTNELLFQSDGLYNPATDQTSWYTPYISSLKVGSLSAIAVSTGGLTVDNNITVGSTGAIRGGATAYALGTGFWMGYDSTTYKFRIGAAPGTTSNALIWDGTSLSIKGALLGGSATAYGTGLGMFSGWTSGTTDANYRWRVGNPTGARIQWTGTAVEVYNGSNTLTLSSGGILYSQVSGTPTSLSEISTTDGNKLDGIEIGATVGANAANFTGKVGGDNLLENSSFEADSNGDGMPDAWGSYTNGSTGTVTSYVFPGGVHGASYFIRNATALGSAATDRFGIKALLSSNVLPSTPFALSGYFNRTGVCRVTLYIDWFTSTGTYIGPSADTFDLDTAGVWYRKILTGTTPATAGRAQVYVWAQEGNGGDVDFRVDAVQLQLGDVATDYSPGTKDLVGVANKLTSVNISTYIAAAAIGWAQVGNLVVDTAGAIRSGQTAYATGTGWWLGFDSGTPKFSIGSSTTYLKWTGTELLQKGLGQEAVQNPIPGAAGANLVTGASGTAQADLNFNSNGTVTLTGGNSTNWYKPTTTNIGTSYYVKFTMIGGTGMFYGGSATASTIWLQLNATRTVSAINTDGLALDATSTKNAIVLAEVSSTASYAGFLGSGTYTLTAIRSNPS